MQNSFENLSFPEDADININNKVAFVTKWNWDYKDSLSFQKKAQQFIQNNRDHKVYIFCNHPHCFTLGRGNERGNDSLITFDESIISNLSLDVHKIHRGGGITFHYPGQWIFYPIQEVNQTNSLDDLMCWMLKLAKSTLEDMGLDKLITAKKLMGVWREKKKLASIGLGLNRFVTEHGLALNLVHDDKMFEELKKINPCGLDSNIYISADQFIESDNLIQSFHKKVMEKLAS